MGFISVVQTGFCASIALTVVFVSVVLTRGFIFFVNMAVFYLNALSIRSRLFFIHYLRTLFYLDRYKVILLKNHFILFLFLVFSIICYYVN